MKKSFLGAVAFFGASLIGCSGYTEIPGPRYEDMNVDQTPTLQMRANVVYDHVRRSEMGAPIRFENIQFYARAQDINDDTIPELIVEAIGPSGIHFGFIDEYPRGSLNEVQYSFDGELQALQPEQFDTFEPAYQSALIVLQAHFQETEIRRPPRYVENLEQALQTIGVQK